MCLESYCCNLKKEDWMNQYAEYLVKKVLVKAEEGKPESPYLYSDPDRTWENQESEFYEKLAKFLNKQEKWLNNQKELLNIKEGSKWTYEFVCKSGGKVGGIHVLDNENNEEPILILRSDQFGFSVPCTEKTLGKKYPYGDYLLTTDLNLPKEDSNSIEVKSKKVAEWVWNTRTIGGSFLWPITETISENKKTGEKDFRYMSIYNMKRGVKYYIQDRVDLTLLEIKEFYDLYTEHKNYEDIKSNMTNEMILLEGEDGEKIFKWLSHFESFKNYVDFFCFEEFIEQREEQIDIVDIARSNLIENKKEILCIPKLQESRFNYYISYNSESERQIKYFYEGEDEPCNKNNEKRIETIEKMLTNVTTLILKRNKSVDKILKQSE